MRKISIILILAACLLFNASAVTAQKAKNTMTNADVLEMVKAGLPESTIVLAIQQSEPNFDTSTKVLIELSKQSVSQKIMDAMLQTQPTKSVPQIKPVDTNAVATKDIGSLRVVLKSIMRVKLPDSWGNMNVNGIRCSFEFINLEKQRPIAVAMNAIAGGNAIGEYLRSTLVDENGELWRIKNSDVAGGISKVGVGILQYDPYYGSTSFYDPADIVTVLSKRDELNSDVLAHQRSGSYYHFIFGSTTEMSPGQSLTVTMTFSQNENQKNSDAPPKVFQMATEIVVGIVNSGTKKSYTLYNLTFDKISLPSK